MARSSAETFPLLIPEVAVAFDAEAFDQVLIRPNGVPFVHWRAMGCCLGVVDPDDMRQPHPDHSGCSNGFIFTEAGVVTMGFVGNSKSSRNEDVGRLDTANVTVLIPRFYDDAAQKEAAGVCECGEDDRVYIAPYDRLFLKKESIVVPQWETFAASGTDTDRLRYPVVRVVDAMDSNGARRIRGVDFEVEGGRIHWLPGRIPPPDQKTGKGMVCSFRYLYRPYWYVRSLPHEVRVAHVDTESEDDDDQVQRLPQVASLIREYVFENERADDRSRDPMHAAREVDRPDDRPTPAIADLRRNL